MSGMKKSAKTAFCGIVAALAVTIMLAAYFPFATYAVPAAAGVLFAVLTIETGRKWAFGAYFAAAFISMLICEKESAQLFVVFFGYYPILKGIIEQRFRGFSEWLLKLLCFNAAVVAAYAVIVFVFSIPLEESGKGGIWFTACLLAVGNAVFIIYDIGLTRVISAYIARLHSRVARLFERGN